MSQTVKIIKRREPLQNLIPTMILEIIQDHILKYVKDNKITKYNVEMGYIEESVIIDIDEDIIETTDRAVLMTYPAKLIEAFIFNYYGINKDVYIKVRNREILKFRQIIQFFMIYYAEMNLAAIGFVTGKKDHASVLHSKKVVLEKIRKKPTIKKELFIIDRSIATKLGISSKIFDIDTNLLEDTIKNDSK